MHPALWLIIGMAFFIAVGWLLYNREPATPALLIDVRDANDSLIISHDSLQTKLKKTIEINDVYQRKLTRLAYLDSVNRNLLQQIQFLSDSIKHEHEKPPVPIMPADPDISDFFSKEYQ